MQIEVGMGYYLRSDERNVIVSKLMPNAQRKGVKEGELVFEDLAYCRDVPRALDYICEREVRLSKVRTWEGLVKAYDEKNKLLKEIGDRLKGGKK